MEGGALSSATESAVKFLTTHASIKSTVMIENVRARLEAAKDRWEFFSIPVVARLLNYEKSLVWMHFVQSQPHLDSMGEAFPWSNFELFNSLAFLAQVHDLAYDEAVVTHSMEDSDEEEDEEEEDGDGGDGEEADD